MQKESLLLKKIGALSIFFGLALSFYYVTKKFDYNWSWSKVPQFFISNQVESVQAPFDGKVEALGEGLYRLTSLSGEEFEFSAKANEIEVDDGEEVYEFDYLASKEEVKVGLLLTGLWMTAKISFCSALLSLLFGLLSGLGRLSKNPIFNWPSTVYIELIRGTPLLVQLFIIYFMIGTVVGIDSRFVCGVIALALFAGAYAGEIIRAGIESIDSGQMEAGRSLGLTHFQTMRFVIFPQMFRRSLAALGGTFISLIKDSSLVSVMALTDLTKAGRDIVSSSFMVFEIWIVVAALYFVVTFLLSMLVKRLENRLSLGERS
ncbi:MAG: amino acid ABC transporter permease [Bacteriovoracaceae bacterium]